MEISRDLDRATTIMKDGGVVVFPTDTVWGVGALMSSKEGVEKFYKVKGRGSNKPSQVLVGNMEVAERYGAFDERVKELTKKYWPGALTLVVKAKVAAVPELVRGGRDKVGLRMPKHRRLLELLEKLDEGVVASSANAAGGEAPKGLDEIDEDWLGRVDLVVEGEALEEAVSSVVDVTGEEMVVLRQGGVDIG